MSSDNIIHLSVILNIIMCPNKYYITKKCFLLFKPNLFKKHITNNSN